MSQFCGSFAALSSRSLLTVILYCAAGCEAVSAVIDARQCGAGEDGAASSDVACLHSPAPSLNLRALVRTGNSAESLSLKALGEQCRHDGVMTGSR